MNNIADIPAQWNDLARLRDERALTQADVAREVFGLEGKRSRETFGDWENGSVTPGDGRRRDFIRYFVIWLGLREEKEFDRVWLLLVDRWKWSVVGEQEWNDAISWLSPHEIPAPPGDFVGRTQEIEMLTEALRTAAGKQDGRAISCVRGMGGIGKTALALIVTNRLVDTFPHGQIFLKLRGSTDDLLAPADVLREVIRAFNSHVEPSGDEHSLGKLYRKLLRDKRVLILADDARGAAQVESLIPPPGSALLITSRTWFNHDEMRTLDLEKLPRAEATTLLLRVRSVTLRQTPSTTRREEEVAQYAAKIADLCGCLPLALRVVAGIIRKTTRPIEEFVALLADERERLNLLHDKSANLDVEASLGLSYRLIGLAEQGVLRQLGVFVADFDCLAAKQVVEAPNGADLVKVLDSLIEAYMLEYDGVRERYTLHELVRVFALKQLSDEGPVRIRYAQHYAAMAAWSERLFLLKGQDSPDGLMLFDRERAHIDACWRWARDAATSPPAGIATDIDWLLLVYADKVVNVADLRYKADERIRQLEVALEAAKRQMQPVMVLGRLLNYLGNAYSARADNKKAIDCYQEVLELARAAKDRSLESIALDNLSIALYKQGDIAYAHEHYERLRAGAHEAGDRAREELALCVLGMTSFAKDEISAAITYSQEALDISREIGDGLLAAHALNTLGNACRVRGDFHAAIDYFRQGRRIVWKLGDQRTRGQIIGNLGLVYCDRGNGRRAAKNHQQHLAIAREIGDRRGQAYALSNLGLACDTQGDAHEAITRYEEALDIIRNIGDQRGEGQILGRLGRFHARLGDVSQAIAFYEQALDICRTIGDRREEADVRRQYDLLIEQQHDITPQQDVT